ncbi:MAG TPA: antitoxin [Micrococcaceae bacterium]|nr:antitoxin [Micrococcaceae bacterium]
MSIFDEIKGKAADLVHGNEDAVRDGIEKAGDFIDSKTGDKYKDHVDGIQKSAEGFASRLADNHPDASENLPADGQRSADGRV